jgi:predicted ArsR family transcriptional regulator
MVFELSVKSNVPLTGEDNADTVATLFLEDIGYITKGSEPAIPLKLFLECFMSQPNKPWVADEMAVKLDTSMPTVYRHLNKLKSIDILEEVKLEEDIKTKDGKPMKQVKKGYKLRYSNLSKAWTFVEAHVSVAMENYRKTVDHLQKMVDSKAHDHGASSTSTKGASKSKKK